MRILDVLNSPWAILPDKLREIQTIYETHLRGDKIDLKGIEAMLGEPLNNVHMDIEVQNGVAIIPIHGVIGKRLNLFSKISGGVSSELLKRDIQIVLDDESVDSILLDIDSPGGSVDGTQELAQFIFEARSIKPIIALANSTMASAAYWIGSAAHEVHISGDTTWVGSIGVVASHVDESKREEREGVKTTEIVAGHFKRVSSGLAPLTEEGHADIQSKVDYIYSVFVADVANFRDESVETVLANMADGKTFIGNQAVEAGLVDGVFTFDQLVADMSGGLDMVVNGNFAVNAIDSKIQSINSSSLENSMNTFQIKDITAAFLAEHCAPLVASIGTSAVDSARADLIAEGTTSGMVEGEIAGIAQETQRIKDVEASLIPGHEALIQSLKFDGKTTGPEAAVKVIQAEKSGAGKVLADIESDSPQPASPVAIDAGADDSADDSNLTIDERAKNKWDASAETREEYGTYGRLVAFMKNSPNIRVKTDR
jgi:signal peptide peptidase SppA